MASASKALPPLSLSTRSAALAFRRVAISSWRQPRSTWLLTSSSVRSRAGVTRGDAVPDVAAVGGDRVVVDADVGGKGGADHFAGMGQVGDRLAARIAAGAVDVVGRRPAASPSAPLLPACCRRRARPRSCRAGSAPRPWRARCAISLRICGATSASDLSRSGSILCTRDEDRAEPAFDRRADLAVLEREGGVGDGRIDEVGLRHGAEIDVLLLQAAFGGERGKAQAVLEPCFGGFGFRHVRKHDLLDVPALRRDVAAAVLVEVLFDVRLGDFHPFADFRRRHLDGGDLAVFRRPEQDFARLEILAQLRRRSVAECRPPAPGRAPRIRCCAPGSGID